MSQWRTGVDNLELARKAVIDTYEKCGYHNTQAFEKILEGEHDDMFVIRAIIEALEMRRAA